MVARRRPSARNALMILPFSLLISLVYWQRQIRIGASLLVMGFGAFRLIDRRHPRALVRINRASSRSGRLPRRSHMARG
jgi:hypothetical protein